MLVGEISKIGPDTIIISILVTFYPLMPRFMQRAARRQRSSAVPDLAASSVCASARQRTIADANAANALGVGAVTEGFAGQTTITKLGLSAGRFSPTEE